MRLAFPLILFAALLSACTPRPVLQVVPEAAAVGDIVEVYYATTRAPDPAELFGTERTSEPSFGMILVSVPPEHEVGSVNVSRRDPDPNQNFVAAGQVRYAERDSFRAALSKALRQRPRGAREAVIYVHGFNNNFAEGIYRIAQLRRDFGIEGVAVHYSWPSLSHPLGYAYDRDSALFARDQLEALIREVKAAGAENVLLVGHSLGSHLIMEALRQIAIGSEGELKRIVGSVVLISPDIDVDVFRSQAERIGTLPDPFVLFVSRRDRVLALSARLSGEQNRLGNVRNVEQVSDLAVTIIDVSDFSEGITGGHFTVASSPALIRILQQLPGIDAVIRGDASGQTGLLAGTVLLVQNATDIVLSPITALSE